MQYFQNLLVHVLKAMKKNKFHREKCLPEPGKLEKNQYLLHLYMNTFRKQTHWTTVWAGPVLGEKRWTSTIHVWISIITMSNTDTILLLRICFICYYWTRVANPKLSLVHTTCDLFSHNLMGKLSGKQLGKCTHWHKTGQCTTHTNGFDRVVFISCP